VELEKFLAALFTLPILKKRRRVPGGAAKPAEKGEMRSPCMLHSLINSGLTTNGKRKGRV